MISRDWAEQFAAEWIDAWNSHDLERIFSHYRDDFEMSSPLIVERMGVPSGTLRGKDAIRPYWSIGLTATPPLKFVLVDVLVGVDCIAIYYRSITRNRLVTEVLQFDALRRVIRGSGLYAAPRE